MPSRFGYPFILMLRKADEENGQFVQAGHGRAQDDRAVWVSARGQEGGRDPRADMGYGTLLFERLRGDDAKLGQEGQHQRNLKDDAESQQEEGDEGKVAVSRHQFGAIGGCEINQPLNRILQDDVAQADTCQEEENADEDE